MKKKIVVNNLVFFSLQADVEVGLEIDLKGVIG